MMRVLRSVQAQYLAVPPRNPLSSFHLAFLSPNKYFCRDNGHDCNSDQEEKLPFYDVRPETFLRSCPPPPDKDGTGEDEEGDEKEAENDDCDPANDVVNVFSPRKRFFHQVRSQADRIFQILQEDGPGVDVRAMLDELSLKVLPCLVREVLFQILKSVSEGNKSRCARLAFKFFTWAGEQKQYAHTSDVYNTTIKIFSECEELKAMWRLVDEMHQKGFPLTPRTFSLLICSCGEAGMRRNMVVRYLKSKDFNFRPYKHSFNAILHCLATLNQYRLIEWVYEQMLLSGHSADVLTYNVVLCAKFRLRKLKEFHLLLDEMKQNEIDPDLHTYNILLHVLGKGDKPLAALNLMNYMENSGCPPRVIHFTTLIDGLSRAGNLDACKYFYDDMIKKGCQPDVVCYTVLITGYIVAGELEKGRMVFEDMTRKGQLPNVFTYNSMIRGLCLEGEFDEACLMLSDMEKRGCTPNFSVYSTLVGRLRSAGKASEAQKIINQMVEKGRYTHLLSRFRVYRRL